MSADQEIARRGLILRGTVGSTAHGLHLGGTDDRDEMGIAIEPPSRLIGVVPELCLLTYGAPRMPESAAARRDHSAGRSPLPPAPDRNRIDRFLVEAYTEAWQELWR